MRHIVQAVLALAVLAGLPVFLETPESPGGEIAAAAGALFLVAVAIHGVVRYVHSRKPRSYADSMMPPPKPGERKPPSPRKED